jgi:large subunit ribosomal protein L36
MKVRSAIKKICASCKLVKRGRKQFVICPANVRHKQRQGYSTLASSPSSGGMLSPISWPAPAALRSGLLCSSPLPAFQIGLHVWFDPDDL